MGPRFPICNANDVIRVLRSNAFVKVGQKGSHQKWRHADGRQVIVADHGTKPIPIGTFEKHHRRHGIKRRCFPSRLVLDFEIRQC